MLVHKNALLTNEWDHICTDHIYIYSYLSYEPICSEHVADEKAKGIKSVLLPVADKEEADIVMVGQENNANN